MKFIVTIEIDNAAFDPDPEPEVARILRAVADRVSDSGNPDHIRVADINGNFVCSTRMES